MFKTFIQFSHHSSLSLSVPQSLSLPLSSLTTHHSSRTFAQSHARPFAPSPFRLFASQSLSLPLSPLITQSLRLSVFPSHCSPLISHLRPIARSPFRTFALSPFRLFAHSPLRLPRPRIPLLLHLPYTTAVLKTCEHWHPI